jgi:hypothetical protein
MSNAFTMTVVLEDGRRYEVKTNLKDQLRYEEIARKNKWGPLGDNLVRFEAYTAWSALERSGDINGMKWDEFQAAVEQIDSAVISPRPTTPEPGSAST